MRAHIITIGNELLIGQVIDSNSAWLGENLTSLGISVEKIISIPDETQVIVDQLETSTQEADFVLISGGLGPTKDDITKTSIAHFLGVDMVFNQDVYDSIVRYLKKLDRPVPDIIHRHAEFPEGTIFLQNKVGSAPGMVFQKNGALIISVPGVPYEMRSIMENEGFSLISAKNNSIHIIQKTILTIGEFEARLSERLNDVVEALPPYFSIAFLPNLNRVRVRLTAKGRDREKLEREMSDQVEKIKAVLGQQVFGFGKSSIEESIGKQLLQKHLTLSTAESCTGGYIAHLITSVPGSSRYFKGSIVAYSNEVKQKMLNVKTQTLADHGAVSEETVVEMVKGVVAATRTDIGISISGIAGPDGGSPEKPVGTIWMACGNERKIVTKKLQLGKDRLKNIEASAIHALDLLRLFIMDEYE
jgi:nicotinamide-nucleotide amidase